MSDLMNISARVFSSKGQHEVSLRTNDRQSSLLISPKADGSGSTVNGGEVLFLALATCYCNDIYREARKRSIEVQSVNVDVSGEFAAEGEPGRNITYRASVAAKASREEILELMRYTDSVAEIHNTLRSATTVTLSECTATPV